MGRHKMELDNMKLCCECGELKDRATDFYRHGGKCKFCTSKYQQRYAKMRKQAEPVESVDRDGDEYKFATAITFDGIYC